MTTFVVLYLLAGLICADWMDDGDLSAVGWLAMVLLGPPAALVGFSRGVGQMLWVVSQALWRTLR